LSKKKFTRLLIFAGEALENPQNRNVSKKFAFFEKCDLWDFKGC
jgi:hypothetical protein